MAEGASGGDASFVSEISDNADAGVYASALHQCPHVSTGGATSECLAVLVDDGRSLFTQLQATGSGDLGPGEDSKTDSGNRASTSSICSMKESCGEKVCAKSSTGTFEEDQSDNKNTCNSCGVTSATPWLCATCGALHCGRYEKGCAVQHALSCNHPVSVGLFDLSFWCYSCESYLWFPSFRTLYDIFCRLHQSKFQEGCTFPFVGDGDASEKEQPSAFSRGVTLQLG